MNVGSGLRVRRLRLKGVARDYDVSFVDRESADTRSLSLVSGAFSTGKSATLEFVDYLLGASRHPQHPEVLRKVQRAVLEIESATGPWVIERSVGEASTRAYIRPGRLNDSQPAPMERRIIKPAGSPESLSSFLLALCGLEGVELREAPTQGSSDTDPLSFRDLMPIVFMPNERVADKNLLYENNQMRRIKLKQVIDVVFGVHDSRGAELGRRITEVETRLSRARSEQAAVVALIEEQQIPQPFELEAAQREATAEVGEIDRRLQDLSDRVREVTSFATELRIRRSGAEQRVRQAAAEVRDQATLLERLLPLRAQYAENVAKLGLLDEARALFDPLAVTACPACFAAVGPLQIHDGRCGLCRSGIRDDRRVLTLGTAADSSLDVADTDPGNSQTDSVVDVSADGLNELPNVAVELRATRGLLREITRYIEEVDSRLPVLRAREEAALEDAEEAVAALTRATAEAVAPALAEQAELLRRRAAVEARGTTAVANMRLHQSVERRTANVVRQEANLRRLREELRSVSSSRIERSTVTSAISARYRDILENWRYPKLSDVYMNDSYVPFMRDMQYVHASSGGRTLISLAWLLAIFEVSYERSAAHPGFLMIDSPQKNLGGPNRDEEFADAVAVDDFYAHLRDWLGGAGRGAQVIVVDNNPPVDMTEDIVAFFSRDPARPPYGLIEDEIG